MKTAPFPRKRKADLSRPRPSAERTRGTASGAGRTPGADPRSQDDATDARVTAPEAAVARHTAEAERARGAPLVSSAPGRAAFLQSFVYAWSGIVYSVRTQRNMRVHIALAALAIALGIWLHISPVEFAMVFVAITGVVVSEMINTVVEACVDLATQEYHPLARVAKDVAAGTVLLSAMLAVVIGCFVYIPHLWPLVLKVFGR